MPPAFRLAPLLLLAAFCARAQSVTIPLPVPAAAPTAGTAAPAPAPAAAPSIFLALGGGYNRYTSPTTSEALLDFGVQIGSSSFYSISTVSMQTRAATFKSGFGYAVRKSGSLLVFMLAQGGVTTTGASTSPTAATFSLGNVGGGLLIEYDFGGLNKNLKGLGIEAGIQMTSITSASIAPEVIAGISYWIK